MNIINLKDINEMSKSEFETYVTSLLRGNLTSAGIRFKEDRMISGRNFALDSFDLRLTFGKNRWVSMHQFRNPQPLVKTEDVSINELLFYDMKFKEDYIEITSSPWSTFGCREVDGGFRFEFVRSAGETRWTSSTMVARCFEEGLYLNSLGNSVFTWEGRKPFEVPIFRRIDRTKYQCDSIIKDYRQGMIDRGYVPTLNPLIFI